MADNSEILDKIIEVHSTLEVVQAFQKEANKSFKQHLEDDTKIQTKINEQLTRVCADIGYIKDEDKEQNKLLAEHIEGVRVNSDSLKLQTEKWEAISEKVEKQEARLSDVEFLPNLISNLRKALIWVGIPAASLYGIYRLIEHISTQ